MEKVFPEKETPEKNPVTILEAHTESGVKVVVTEDLSKPHHSQIFGMANLAAQGEQPSNADITDVLESTKEILEEERGKSHLTTQGKVLAKDTEDLIDTTKKFLQEKNPDEIMQKMVKETQEAIMEMKKGMESGQVAPLTLVEFEKFQKESERLFYLLRELILSVIRSGDVRDMLGDGLQLLQNLLEIQKKQVQGEKEQPLTSEPQPKSFTTEPQPKPFTSEPQPKPFKTEPQPKSFTTGPQPKTSTGGTGLETPISKPMEGAKTEWQQWNKTSTSAQEEMTQTLQDLKLSPEERKKMRQETLDKFLNWLEKIGNKSEYKELVHVIFETVDKVSKRAEWIKEQAPEWESLPGVSKMNKAIDDARKILSRFTGKRQLRKFQLDYQNLWDQIFYDSDFRRLLSEMKQYIQEILLKPELLKKPTKREEAQRYLEHLEDYFNREHYKQKFNDVYEDINEMLESIKNDSTTKEFQLKLQRFTQDFALNEKGEADIYVLGNSVDQLRVLFVPMLKKFLENIPIDRVDIISSNYDVTIKDLTFSGTDILPEFIDFRMDNKFHLNLKDTDQNVTKTRLVALISHIKPKFKDLKFSYKRKTFPKIEDFGVCNLAFTGDGARLKFIWELHSIPGVAPKVVLLENKCHIDSIDIQIHERETKHSWLDKILAVFLQQRIKHEISGSIEDYLYHNIESINLQMNKFFAENPWDLLKQKATQQLYHTFSK